MSFFELFLAIFLISMVGIFEPIFWMVILAKFWGTFSCQVDTTYSTYVFVLFLKPHQVLDFLTLNYNFTTFGFVFSLFFLFSVAANPSFLEFPNWASIGLSRISLEFSANNGGCCISLPRGSNCRLIPRQFIGGKFLGGKASL